MATSDWNPSSKSPPPPRLSLFTVRRQSGSPNNKQPRSSTTEQPASPQDEESRRRRSFADIFPKLSSSTRWTGLTLRKERSRSCTPRAGEMPTQPEMEGTQRSGSLISEGGEFQRDTTSCSGFGQGSPESPLTPQTPFTPTTPMTPMTPLTYRAVPLTSSSTKRLLGNKSAEGDYCLVIKVQSMERLPLAEGDKVQVHWNYYNKGGASPFRRVKADKSVDFNYVITISPKEFHCIRGGFTSAVHICLQAKEHNQVLQTIEKISVKLDINEPPHGRIDVVTASRIVMQIHLCVFKEGQALLPMHISNSRMESMKAHDDAVKVFEEKVKKAHALLHSEGNKLNQLQTKLKETQELLGVEKYVPQDVLDMQHVRHLSSESPTPTKAYMMAFDDPVEENTSFSVSTI